MPVMLGLRILAVVMLGLAVAHSRKQFLCLTCPLPSRDLVVDEIAAFESLQPDFIVVTTP